MNMHSKYDNIHRNGMNYNLKCTNNFKYKLYVISASKPHTLALEIIKECHCGIGWTSAIVVTRKEWAPPEFWGS